MPPIRTFLAFSIALSLTEQQPVAMRHIQPELFAATGSLVNALADIDRDGDVDIFVGFNGAPNRLYRNDGGTFVEIGAMAGVADARATRAAAFGDWDADGDPDLLVGFAPGAAGPVLRLYRNDRGRFVDATEAAGLRVDSGAVRQPVWIDYDADDDLDLFVAFRDRPNALYRNTAGRLVDIAPDVGLADTRRSVGAVWADLDSDGDLDVIVGNMDGDANGVFRNDAGTFTDVATGWGLAAGGRALGERTSGTVRPCVADMDGDGHFDIITANYGPAGLFLRRDSAWVDAGAEWGLVDGRYDACAPADLDNDGRLDLYINGTVTAGRNWPDYLYRNTGTRLENAIPDILSAIPADHGAQWADFNGDGAVDLALTGQGPHAVLANVLPDSIARRSLSIRVLDRRGRATRAGAAVRVYAAGTRRVLATRLVDAGSGYDAQSDVPVHIGLPTMERVDIEVVWPSAGRRQTTLKRDVRVGGRKTLEIRVP
jgi:hypothetical protein